MRYTKSNKLSLADQPIDDLVGVLFGQIGGPAHYRGALVIGRGHPAVTRVFFNRLLKIRQ